MKERALKIIKALKKEYPDSECALHFKNPFQLLVATILSAQCTDKRVNIVTKSLFRDFPSVKAFAEADIHDLEEAIRSTGFYRNKAKNIQKTAQIIRDEFRGKVPKTMPELLRLAGVARKTANIVLTTGYGLVDGIAVDTHVTRLTNRLRLTKHKEATKIESDLMRFVPKKYWGELSLLFIDHGRKVCDARKPECDVCCLVKLCPSKKIEKV